MLSEKLRTKGLKKQDQPFLSKGNPLFPNYFKPKGLHNNINRKFLILKKLDYISQFFPFKYCTQNGQKLSILSATWLRILTSYFPFELVFSIRYKLACVYSKDSNQSGHTRSLIRILVFYLKRCWTLGYQKSAHRRLGSDCTDVQSDPSL